MSGTPETAADLQAKWDKRGKKLCGRGEHETSFPIFRDAKIGGIVGWACFCGHTVEPPVSAPLA